MEIYELTPLPSLVWFQEGPGVRNTQYTNSGVKLLNVANLIDGHIDLSTSNRYIAEEEAYGRYRHFLCDKGDLVIASSGIKVDYFDKKMGFVRQEHLPLCMNTSTIRFKVLDNNILNIRYFMYFLKSNLFKRQLSKQITGSAQLNFGPSHLKRMFVPLINIDHQNHICGILDKVYELEYKLQTELALLNQLVKSRFLELFGDPLAGNAKWPIHNLCMVADAIDPQPSHRAPPIDKNGIPYISIKDCDYNTGKIDFEKARKVNVKVLQEHKTRYQIHNGDMMIGKIGTIGYPVFLPTYETYTLSANVILIQPNKSKVQPCFLKYSLESPYVESQFDKAKHSTSQSAFGILKIRKIKVMNPELSIQNQFADFVNQVDKSKMAVQKSLDELEILKKSLMQTYFG